MKTIFTYGLLLLTLLSHYSWAQEVDVVVDRKQIRIGEQAEIKLSVAIPKENPPQVRFPQIGDTLVAFVEVLHRSDIDTLPTAAQVKETRLEQRIYITSFDTGYYAIPPFTFVIDGVKASTQAFLFEVQWYADADTASAPLPIRDIYTIELNALDYISAYWPYAIGGLVLVGLLVVVVLLLKKWMNQRAARTPEAAEAPVVPAHIRALEALEEAKRNKLYTRNKTKQYHTEITDIVRNYLEEALRIPAHELTTRQIVARLRYEHLPKGAILLVQRIMELADMVKFAKERPDDASNEQVVDDAIDFIKRAQIHVDSLYSAEQGANDSTETTSAT